MVPARCGLVMFAVFVLASCGGGGGDTPPTTPTFLPPVARATASPSNGVAPLAVTFDGTGSSDPQGLPLTYSWTFGDGTNGSGATVSHTFQNHGSFSVTVAANNGHGTTTSSPVTVAVSAAAPTIQAATVTVNVLGITASQSTSQISALDRESLPLSYSIATPPAVGTASISASGLLTYQLAGHATTSSDSLTVQVTNGLTPASITVPVTLNRDPLLASQWHLQNTGQDAFASTRPVTGNDMNVAGAWAAGYSGRAIKVGVVDSGLEAAHEDLAANFDLANSLNFAAGGGHDPSPTGTGFDHGTAVAGIIGSVAFNGKGGRGVAYNARLRGYNLIGNFSLVNMAAAMGGDPASADSDIFNASFGAVSNALPTFSASFQTIATTTLAMRGGLGAPIVNAAGNDFQDVEGASSPLCALSRRLWR